MNPADTMPKLVMDLARAMVREPGSVAVTVEEFLGTIEVNLTCDDDDVRRLVGAGGGTIGSLAVVAKALAFGCGKSVFVRRVSPLRGTRGSGHAVPFTHCQNWDADESPRTATLSLLRRVVEACYCQPCEITEVTRANDEASSQVDVLIRAAPDGEWTRKVASALNIIFATIGNQVGRRLHVRIIETNLGGEGDGAPGHGGAAGLPRAERLTSNPVAPR